MQERGEASKQEWEGEDGDREEWNIGRQVSDFTARPAWRRPLG